MRKLLVGAGVVAAIAAASVLSFWAGSRNSAAPATANGSAPKAAPGKAAPGIVVEAAKVSLVKLPQSLTAVGSLRSDETVILRPEIVGRVSQILFKEGERVDKGAVLVKLDASVQQADADRAKANLVLSKSKYDRAVDLRNQGFISGQAKDEAENMLRVAQADYELVQARLAKTVIPAPFSGTVGLRQVSVGDYVKEGQDIVNLESLDPLKVDFRVPEIYLSLVRDGQTLQITLDALPDRVYDGRVYAINPLIDANGRSIVVRAQVPNKDGRLRPGMFARVRLFTSQSKDSLVIPEESLFPVGDDKYVYKVVDGKATRQKVDIGQRRDGRVEILNGLAAEDVVVTAGALKLREGAAVSIANSPTQAPPVGKADTPKTKGSWLRSTGPVKET
jgi:membrane fusion protein, multidrug efflux system